MTELLEVFNGKAVILEVEHLKVEGRLRVSWGRLILETESGKILVTGFDVLKEVK